MKIIESQMSTDDFEDEPHDGIEYTVDKVGTASVSQYQMSLDDIDEYECPETVTESNEQDPSVDSADYLLD
ncbi:hypothetical protein [Bacillus sp. MUM 116]|uniref:hypothetical protein n=1 Tax=Bacillus sp. MUM 116 TaxID=1678002 RepID=UPI00114D43C9|nr:hypothetical protein [Bacillus sp. MUM 116]